MKSGGAGDSAVEVMLLEAEREYMRVADDLAFGFLDCAAIRRKVQALGLRDEGMSREQQKIGSNDQQRVNGGETRLRGFCGPCRSIWCTRSKEEEQQEKTKTRQERFEEISRVEFAQSYPSALSMYRMMM